MAPLPISPEWTEDILGPDFERRTFDVGIDPDGQPPVVVTLVRYLPEGSESTFHTRKAILYIPGTSDYFFHKHVAKYFHEQGYAFYSVDFRKCARSHQEGQRWYYISDLGIYFKDLTIATTEIINAGHSAMVMMAHSMGCLTAAMWIDHLQKSQDNTILPFVKGIIMNSPWLDLMFSFPTVAMGRRLAPIMATHRPEAKLHTKKLEAYVSSLHKDLYGEWDFSLEYKPVGGHDKYWGWIHAVIRSIDRVKSGKVHCRIPILVLCSSKSWLNKPYSEESNICDVVLDIDESIKWSNKLGDDVTTISIQDARHDVFLSREKPRNQALTTCGQWLAQQRL
ncbi:lysophospholipase L2 [Corynebacterium kalinowskii]|uniref:Lysophospholipase L2 n=1 Tax=Corynebacterium kalinowskii TaxID=2675216 RepID=A0A6B8VDL1_9CORY|nr:alpha/beta hydrolase [Corynebacterium kalinowskii]QGU02273.1 lysophospholipase L2 [Corynebacterium kalinowskii]